MELDTKEYDEFENRLKEKYPVMFSRPYGGICIGKGWWPILEELCENIHQYLEEDKNRGEVFVAQIKEKFGGLRFYYDGGNEHIRDLVTAAENKAGVTCEVCGAPGKERPTVWVKTLCDLHHEERDRRIREYTDKK